MPSPPLFYVGWIDAQKAPKALPQHCPPSRQTAVTIDDLNCQHLDFTLFDYLNFMIAIQTTTKNDSSYEMISRDFYLIYSFQLLRKRREIIYEFIPQLLMVNVQYHMLNSLN